MKTRNTRENELLYLYLFFDLIILNVTIWVSILSFASRLGVEHTEWYYFLHGNLSWVVTFFIFPKRNLYLRDGFSNRFIRITRRTLYFMVISLLLAFVTYRFQFSLKLYFTYVMLLWLGKMVFYWFLYRYLLYARVKGNHTRRCAIVNQGKLSKRLKMVIDCNPILGYRFVGFVTSSEEEGDQVLGSLDRFEDLLVEHQIETVFIHTCNREDFNLTYKDVIECCRQKGVRLRFIPDSSNWNQLGSSIETLMGIPLVDPLSVPLDSIWNQFWKRMFDIFFSLAVILLLLWWLFPILALIVKLSSKGPVFFPQKRTGLNNHTFTCYKFRSMRVNEDSDKVQATADDDRITCIGRIMRRTNMDEFPQFFNVLAGHMSVVGPRPHMLAHTEMYSNLIDAYLQRHFVRPGITGWAQVNGLRGETDELWKMEKRVEYDMEYIRTWSFWLDLKIIFMTVLSKKTYYNAH
jgi:putative colanic acid biosysnthesis UDP-glucose lipid carrier transferase